MDYIFAPGSPGDGEDSAIDGEDDQKGSQKERFYDSKPEKESRNPPHLQEQAAAASSTDMESTRNKVIAMIKAANGISQVVVMEPRSFDEMSQAIQALLERKVVVLNLTIFDPEQAQRAADFVAGGTYAIDGRSQWIGEKTFLFTPSCVQVSC